MADAKQSTAIHWFRQDLRLRDNPALRMAAGHERVLPVYILDDVNSLDRALGGASRVWLHHSLGALEQSLGGNLSFYEGDPISVLQELVKRHNVTAIYWNRCYEPWRIRRDAAIKSMFQEMGVAVKSLNGSLLWEPWTIRNKEGNPYKVFTPFYRKGCVSAETPRHPLPTPKDATYINDTASKQLDDLKLLPNIPWHKSIESEWEFGENAAQKRLLAFIDQSLDNYKNARNIPSQMSVSKLSPYLHFGEISPNQIWHKVRSLDMNDHIDSFCSELGWREFSYSLLYHMPDMPTQSIQPKFDAFPWVNDAAALQAWQRGQTGIPMVDAGMRELWQTGYMHNRARMIVHHFLSKICGLIGARASAGSGIHCLTLILPIMPRVGNGLRVAAQMLRLILEFLTP